MEKQLATKISKLSPAKTKGGFSVAYSYQPEEFLEKQHGSLFFIVEIASPSPASKEIGEMIIDVIKEEYYADLNRNPATSFEAALKTVNEELALACEQGETDWLGKLNVICGLLSGETFHLTCVGSAEAYLVRNEKINHISKDLSSPSDVTSYPLKTFANIASGEVEPKDKIILSSSGLFYYVSLEKLRKIVVENTPAKAISKLAEFLKTEEGVGEVSALIVEINTIEAISQQTIEKEEEEIFIEEPKSKLKLISEKIKPSFLKLGSLILSVGKNSMNFFRNRAFPSLISGCREIKSKAYKASQSISEYRKAQIQKRKIEKAREEEAAPLVSKPKKPYQTYIDNIKEGYKIFKQKIKTSSFKSLANFRPSENSKKLFLFLVTCLVVFFLLSTIGYVYKRKRDTRLVYLNNVLTSALKKQEDAKNLLIYDDQNKARSLLNEALSLTDQLLKEKYKIAQVKGLRDSIFTQLDKANGVNRIINPEALGDFSQTGPADITTCGLYLIGNELYSFNPDTNIIYKLNLESREVKIVFDKTPPKVEHFQKAHIVNDILLIYDELSGINAYNPDDNSFTEKSLPLGQKWEKAKDLAFYGTNLYLLSPQENKIFVHFKTWSGYSKGWDYIEGEVDLKNAVSIAIPGEVLVLNLDGTILKFSKGFQKDFTINNLPDSLNEPSEIFGNAETENIYIVDSKNKRVVVLDPQGKFINQYVCDSFDNISGIYVDEKTSKMYILNKNKVYEINIEASLGNKK